MCIHEKTAVSRNSLKLSIMNTDSMQWFESITAQTNQTHFITSNKSQDVYDSFYDYIHTYRSGKSLAHVQSSTLKKTQIFFI